ncbi:MAG: efflux RND transporter permease subunit [Chloroflexi bacterium]|nr:efflux RND transporter permease subunit [Chloroflexota bacterium]
MMWLTHTAVAKPLAIVAIVLAVVAAGVASFFALPINLFPQFNVPVVVVTTAWAGASPNEVELQITRPVEDAVSGLQNIDNITSTSGQGISSVVITFTDKANPDLIDSQVQRQLATVQGQLPTDPSQAITPITTKVDPNALPVMQVALISDTLSNTDLYSLANDTLSPQLQQVTGVSQVAIVGGQQQEVQVLVDPNKLAGYGLSLLALQNALAAGNTAVPAGSLTQDPNTYNLRVSNLAVQPQDLGRITIGGTADAPVRVSDVASVQLTGQQQTQITRVNGHNGVLFRLSAQTGANTTDVSDGVSKLVPQLQAQLPPGAALVTVQDSSTFIRSSVNGVLEELVSAIVLTSIVLLLFLHSPRVSIIVLMSIPTTLLATFSIMRVLDFSLNFISTLALILTIGILVDDSIVILENTLRHLSRGESPRAAAINGRAEIGLAALTITLVDVVIFAPTGLVSGQVGAFFKEFGFTIAAATLCSLIISFTLTPMLASRLLRPEREDGRGPWARFSRGWDAKFGGLELTYHRLLEWCFKHRWAPLIAAFALLVGGIALVPLGVVPVEFFPNIDQGSISINTTVAPGTSLDAHDAIMRQIETQLAQVPEVQTYSASIGASQTFGVGAASITQGTVSIDIGSRQSRSRSVFAVADDIRSRIAGIPNATIQVQVNGGNGAGQAEQVRIQGPDVNVLTSLANQLQTKMEQVPGLTGVTNTASAALPELQITVDPARASALGITPATVGGAVRTSYSGVVATKWRRSDGKQIDVRVLLSDAARANVSALGVVPLQTTGGQIVPLNQVATIAQVPTPNEIDRRDRQRVVTVGADISTGYVQSQVDPVVQSISKQLALPAGYTVSFGGNAQSQSQAFGDLFAALGISVLLAYLLMAILYNSLLEPLIILFGLPVAFGGALISSALFRYTFNLFSLIGVILLVGLAIKNGILLVDRTNHNRERGMGRVEAVLEAGPARLRAILMTSATIVVALLPSAFQLGEGSEIRAPLAATVVGGVIASTLLTLVVVPTMYTILDTARARFSRRHPPQVERRAGPTDGTSARPPAAVDADGKLREPVVRSAARPQSQD